MLTRRSFTLLAATLPLGLLQRREAEAQAPPIPTIEEEKRRAAEWQKAHHLPVALVHARGEKRLYSGAVNSILCWADAGPVTWLGTRLGIKRVSKEPSTPPRHYTRADGLPGERVNAIVADERGAYALVDLWEEEALCAFEPEQDRWKTLARWRKGRFNEYPDVNEGCLALGRDVVLATPRVVSTKADSPLVCFDRERQEIRNLPWDAGTRGDHAELQIPFLSCREKTVQLGTNIGLIELPLSADGGPWTRRLNEQSIRYGVEGSGRLYLWLTPRQSDGPSRYFQPYDFIRQGGQLNLYDPASNTLQPLPEKPRQYISEATVDADGALWLFDNFENIGQRARMLNQVSILLARWKPGDTAWRSFDATGVEVTSPTVPRAPANDPYAPYRLWPIPGAEVIPEAPARLVASNAALDGVPSSYRKSENSGKGYASAARWLKERFPHWVSPEDPEAAPGAELFGYPLRQAAYPDPKDPERFWVGRGQGTLAPVGSKEVYLPPARAESNLVSATGADHARLFPDAAPGQITLPPQPLELHAKIRSLIALGDGTYIATGTHAFHISQGGRRWRELKLPPRTRDDNEESLSYSAFFFPTGKGKALLSTWPGNTLFQPDVSAGKLIPTQITQQRNGSFIGADSSGAWWHTGKNKYQFLAPGSTEWQVRGAEKPAGITLYE
ncbi:MAG: hypothetical protein QM758_21350 [Armatimonas sp.]